MTSPITVIINGEVVAKGRPGMTRKGFAYTPAATRKYEAHARLAAGLARADRPPLQGPVKLEPLVELPVPASWSKRKHKAATVGDVLPTSRPDLDNNVKSALDPLNGIVIVDELTNRRGACAKEIRRPAEASRNRASFEWRGITREGYVKIIGADARLTEKRGAKILIVGPAGVGKTSLLRTLDPKLTLFVEGEAGDLAVQDVPVSTVCVDDWPTARDLACRIGGPNPIRSLRLRATRRLISRASAARLRTLTATRLFSSTASLR